MYDAGLSDEEDEVEVGTKFILEHPFSKFGSFECIKFVGLLLLQQQGFSDFLQEMASLVNDVRKEVSKSIVLFKKHLV